MIETLQKNRALLVSIAAILLLAAVYYSGLRGIDFGYHWDEPLLLSSVAVTAQNGVPLPHWYNYPSVSYDISLAAALPKFMKGPIASSDFLAAPFVLHVRRIFFILCTLALLWTFLLVLKWRNSAAEAILAAAILGSSWEVLYHSRWIAPDALLMQFSILAMLLLFSAIQDGKHRARLQLLAAVVVGICIGTKYTGAFLLLPLIASSVLIKKEANESAKSGTHSVAILMVVCALSFLITTPGVIFEWKRVLNGVGFEMKHYQSGHGGYTVPSPAIHFWLMLKYFLLVAFSHNRIIAVLFFLFAAAGAYFLWRESRRLALWFLSVPVLYCLYFSTQKVMIVRNFLLAFPFFAILAAHGISMVFRHLKTPLLRTVFSVLVLLCICENFLWLVESTNTIVQRRQINHALNVLAYLEEHPNQKFWLSRDVQNLVGTTAGNLNNIVELKEADRAIFSSTDVKNLADWRANVPGRYTIVSGMYELNFDYYPTWTGDAHIVSTDRNLPQQLRIVEPNP